MAAHGLHVLDQGQEDERWIYLPRVRSVKRQGGLRGLELGILSRLLFDV